PSKTYTSVIFSSSDMAEGETYTVCVNGSSVGTVTLSSVSTTSGSSATTRGGMGGGGGPMP
ncbi:MAG: hypothetical protein Q4C25_06825, partial [Bacillota bacterium]|nr:hypothetical protein [Bacillota bacterium]